MVQNQINNQVDSIQVILDKRIPLKLLQVSEGENVIFCKQFREELFDSGFFSTKEKDFVHNYITENEQKYIITDVSTPDGKTYQNVKFKIVISEKKEIPLSTFNPSRIEFINENVTIPKTIVPETQQILEKVKTPVSIDLTEQLHKKEQDKKYLEKAKNLEKQLQLEKTRLLKEKKNLEIEKQQIENEKIVFEKLDDYKQDLLREFIDVSEKQKTFIQEQISENFKIVDDKLTGEIQTFHLNSENVLDQLNLKNIGILKQEIEKKINEKQKELETLLENSQLSISQNLVEKADELKKLFKEKFVLDLENYKTGLTEEITGLVDEKTKQFIFENKKSFNEQIIKYFKEEKKKAEIELEKGLDSVKNILEKTSEQLKSKTPELDERIQVIDEKIQQLVEERKQTSILVSEAKTYADKEIQKALEDAKNYARRILELGGGGGSVAVQYANGGTMNGDLNVTGHYLSAGVNLLNIFTGGGGGGGGGGDAAVNALVHSNSGYWNEAYTNLVNNSASYLTGTAVNLGNIPILSGYWNTAYTNLVSNSASYLTGASLNYVNTNFVKISGDTMTGTLSVAPAAYVLSPSFATFVKNNSYSALSATLRQ
ncbi:MAG: hypothetical protein EBU90_27415, partial [Proteobacteria bacterium]|nr:hypothetical protein [Pseudomonadota bacterium]